jgi:DNA-binding NarL/FixJ family response regulator
MAPDRPITVLVADHDPAGLQGLEELLSEAEGIDVVAASADGRDAVRLAAEHQPAVILVLPRESIGKYLVDAIRATAHGEAAMTRVVGSTEARSPHQGAVDQDLSPRELNVVRLVAEGRTNGQIARALDTSVSTVKAQLSTLFEKLGARDRASAVAACFRRGVLK